MFLEEMQHQHRQMLLLLVVVFMRYNCCSNLTGKNPNHMDSQNILKIDTELDTWAYNETEDGIAMIVSCEEDLIPILRFIIIREIDITHVVVPEYCDVDSVLCIIMCLLACVEDEELDAPLSHAFKSFIYITERLDADSDVDQLTEEEQAICNALARVMTVAASKIH